MARSIRFAALLIIAALSLGSCRDYWIHRVTQQSLRAVAKELAHDSHVDAADLRARFSPIGEGLFVYPVDVLERGQPAIVWLIKGGKPYALNEKARALTPRLLDAREIPNELVTSAEQSSQLQAMV